MIQLDSIGKSFGDFEAVKSVSLTIAEGEFVSLLGPSGCGKTTTLRIVAGFETPSSGRLMIGGRDMTDVPVERRGLSMVFQNYALFPHLSVYENVAFGLRLKRIGKPEIAERVHRALDQVGLAGLDARSPRQLSGGQQQRVSLARALVVNPSVLLMDEPLSNLDLKLREQLRGEIRSLQRSLGITAIYVTHDQDEAMAMSDRIAVMNAGRIEQVGAARDIYERPRTTFVASFIGQCNLQPGVLEGTRFRTSAGLALDVEAAIASSFERGNIRLAIRPETIQFGPIEGGNRLDARVSDVVYLGNIAQVTVVPITPAGTETEPLVAVWRTLRGQAMPAVGDRLTIAVAAADCVPVFERAPD